MEQFRTYRPAQRLLGQPVRSSTTTHMTLAAHLAVHVLSSIVCLDFAGLKQSSEYMAALNLSILEYHVVQARYHVVWDNRCRGEAEGCGKCIFCRCCAAICQSMAGYSRADDLMPVCPSYQGQASLLNGTER